MNNIAVLVLVSVAQAISASAAWAESSDHKPVKVSQKTVQKSTKVKTSRELNHKFRAARELKDAHTKQIVKPEQKFTQHEVHQFIKGNSTTLHGHDVQSDPHYVPKNPPEKSPIAH